MNLCLDDTYGEKKLRFFNDTAHNIDWIHFLSPEGVIQIKRHYYLPKTSNILNNISILFQSSLILILHYSTGR